MIGVEFITDEMLRLYRQYHPNALSIPKSHIRLGIIDIEWYYDGIRPYIARLIEKAGTGPGVLSETEAAELICDCIAFPCRLSIGEKALELIDLYLYQPSRNSKGITWNDFRMVGRWLRIGGHDKRHGHTTWLLKDQNDPNFDPLLVEYLGRLLEKMESHVKHRTTKRSHNQHAGRCKYCWRLMVEGQSLCALHNSPQNLTDGKPRRASYLRGRRMESKLRDYFSRDTDEDSNSVPFLLRFHDWTTTRGDMRPLIKDMLPHTYRYLTQLTRLSGKWTLRAVLENLDDHNGERPKFRSRRIALHDMIEANPIMMISMLLEVEQWLAFESIYRHGGRRENSGRKKLEREGREPDSPPAKTE